MKDFIRFALILALLGCTNSSPCLASAGPEQLYLSGHGKDDAIPWKFMCSSGAQSSFWTNIPVPSNWELFGFGTLNYYRDLTNAWTEHGLYQHEFRIPGEWKGSRIFLVFNGVMTDCEARINGHSLEPIHQGAFYRFKYEITDLARIGASNSLEVTVSKHSSNASVNKAERAADYWVFGGIFRPVYLEREPVSFIDHVAIDAKSDGTFSANVFGDAISNSIQVIAQIETLNGSRVGKPFLAGFENAVASLSAKFPSPKTWTAETPNLYQLKLSLSDGAHSWGTQIKRFGFRTMEVRDGDGFYLNGSRIILKGACRHSFWPESGRTLSEAVHRLDITTMKDMNMNAVRMSHYPPDEQFLDLCDELGLYVLDELGGWHQCYDTNVGPRLVKEMVIRDQNHPCILFWDNGNEGGWNTNLDNVFANYDPQNRRVLHPWSPFNGVGTAHYLAYDKAALACQGFPAYYHKGEEIADTNGSVKYIYMPTEFNHGLFDGGAGAGLEDFWALMSSSKLLGGGFIWTLLDECVKRADNGKIDVAGNQAPDGIVGPYRQREASFYTIKSIWSPITVEPGQNLPSSDIKIANHFGFLNANQCKFKWELRKFPDAFAVRTNATVVASGNAKVPSIQPGATGTIHLELPANWNTWGQTFALALAITDPTGREINNWVWPVSPAVPQFSKSSGKGVPFSARDTADRLVVNNGHASFTFSKTSGMLLSSESGLQKFSLTNGPRATVGSSVLKSISTRMDGHDCLVECLFAGSLKKVSWRITPDNWLQCDYTYTAQGSMDYFGIVFDYPESQVKSKKWLGDGPYRVWKNRLQGVHLGVWENDYNNTITGWSEWNYPEFKGCFAHVRWMQFKTDEGLITLESRNNAYVQVLKPELPPKELFAKTVFELPKAGLAFLDAIPPVGSKFKEAKYSGPNGQQNTATGDYSGSIRFHFGNLE